MRKRRLVPAAAWVAALGLAAFVLGRAGHGALSAPPLADPAGWAPWLEARTPVVAAFSLLRLASLGALWYLAVVTAVGTILRLAGAASAVRVADRFTVAPVRRLLAGSVSLGLAASGMVAVAAPAARLSVAAAQTTAQAPADTPPTVTMHRLGPADAPVTPAAAPAAQPTPTTARTWTVKPGECFWSIAELILTERAGRPPTDAEIVPYWNRLIQANRGALVVADDPHLIFPGQVFNVPAP